jgi:tetratricopeptide (TPR) repeat protein
LFYKGSVLSRIDKYEEAVKCYDEALKIEPKNIQVLYNNCKSICLNLGNILNKLDLKYINAWHNKGFSLVNLGRDEEAVKCFDEILTKLDHKNIHALNSKGWTLDNLEISRSHTML